MDFFNKHKILYHIDRLDDWLSGKPIFPVMVEIDVSNACNHDCIWCTFENFRKSKTVFMPKKLLFRTIGELAACGVKSVVWTGGGEPLTHPDIIPAIEKAAESGLKSGLFTNGGLLGGSMADTLLSHCEFVRVSLDAATADTHKLVHKTGGESEFDNIVKNIKTLAEKKKKLKSKTTIGVTFLVHRHNLKDIGSAALLARRLGADYIQYKPVVIWGGGPQLEPYVFRDAKKMLEEAQNLQDGEFKVFVIDYKFEDISGADKKYGRSYDKCYGHPFIGTICADGKVYLCCHSKGIDKYCLGDLNTSTFGEIWTGRRSRVADNIDFNDCQPLCKLHEINKLLHFILNPKNHKNFL